MIQLTPWKLVILLCGKCARKMDGGFGHKGRETLRGALRAELAARGRGREVRIVETRCLGLCPKKSVTAMNASAPGVIVTVPRKTPADAALDLILAPVREPGGNGHAARRND